MSAGSKSPRQDCSKRVDARSKGEAMKNPRENSYKRVDASIGHETERISNKAASKRVDASKGDEMKNPRENSYKRVDASKGDETERISSEDESKRVDASKGEETERSKDASKRVDASKGDAMKNSRENSRRWVDASKRDEVKLVSQDLSKRVEASKEDVKKKTFNQDSNKRVDLSEGHLSEGNTFSKRLGVTETNAANSNKGKTVDARNGKTADASKLEVVNDLIKGQGLVAKTKSSSEHNSALMEEEDFIINASANNPTKHGKEREVVDLEFVEGEEDAEEMARLTALFKNKSSKVIEPIKVKQIGVKGSNDSILQRAKKDVDDLFGSATLRKRAKKSREQAAEKEQQRAQLAEKARVKQIQIEGRSEIHMIQSGGDPRVHRYDHESGLPVYKFFDLGMAKPGSGFTPLCPFDCDCCY